MASVTSKLRDSCNACAVSKIKCPKEKPKCSRCESRGVACHYSFTRRPGRRPENNDNSSGNESRRRLSSASGAIPTLTAITVGTKVRGSLDNLSSIGSDHGSKRTHSSSGSSSGPGTVGSTSTGTGIGTGPGLQRAQISHDILDGLFWSESPGPAAIQTPATSRSITGTPSNMPGIDGGRPVSSYFDMPLTNPTSTTTATTRPSSVSTPALNDGLHVDSTDAASLLGDVLELHPDFDGFAHRMDEFIDLTNDSHFAPPTPGNSDSPTTIITPKPADIAALLIPSINANAGRVGHSHSHSHSHSGPAEEAVDPGSISPSLFAWPDPAFCESSASTLSLLSSAMSSSPSQLPQLPGIFDSPSACHLAQSLEILKNLSSAQSSQPAAAASFSGGDTAAAADSFTKLVLGENQQSIDAVGAILSSSSCGSDSFLLAILSMTVLKILERYDAAAKAGDELVDWLDPGFSSHLRDSHMQSISMPVPHGGQGPDHQRGLGASSAAPRRPGHGFGDHDHDGGGRETAAARLVLGELHRVQRLVNEVSRESEKHRESSAAGDRDLVMRDSCGLKSSSLPSPQPLVTTSTLAQLEIDMRKNLNALSTGIIDRLRQR